MRRPSRRASSGRRSAGDGGGSIRFPSAYCGLFGLKTQRGRVPLAPRGKVWQGLVVAGVLTRSVRDTALFHDAIADGPPDADAPPVPASSFLDALKGATGASAGGQGRTKLRVAVASRLPPSPLTRLHPDNRAALEETAELLRGLGHEVIEHELDHGRLAPPPEFTVLYLHSIHEEVAELPHPERLERRLRTIARLGGKLPAGSLRVGQSAQGRLCGEAEQGVRRPRCPSHAGHAPARARDRRVRGAGLVSDCARLVGNRPIRSLLEHDRPARLLGAGGIRRGRHAEGRPAGRAAE